MESTFTNEVKQSLLTATGLTMNIDTTNLSEEDAKKLAEYIKWHTPGGAAMTSESIRGKAAEALTEWVDKELLKEEPTTEPEQDSAGDSDNIDNNENKSQIEIESKEKEPASKDDKEDTESTESDKVENGNSEVTEE